MFIITVTPIAKGIFKDQLTYFSQVNLPLGSIVTVPLRSKNIDALVITSQPANSLKTELKRADFALKKIVAVKNEQLLLPEFLTASQKTADHYATTLGQIIKAALPQTILEKLSPQQKSDLTLRAPMVDFKDDGTIPQHKFILQETAEERMSFYKALIRESFAKKQSVLLCLPTIVEVNKFFSVLSVGLSNYTICLHSDLNKKVLAQNWQKINTNTHPLLILATPSFLAIPRPDLKNIILEKENHSAYKQFARPFIDFRFLAERLAEELKARLIFGDLVLRAETIFRSERGEFAHLTGLKYRVASMAEQKLLNARNDEAGDKNIYAVGIPLRKELTEIIARREKILIYSGRKGLSTLTVCNDCGESVRCSRCHNPLSLHKNSGQKKYFYLCHRCGQSEEVSDRCAVCGSWRLALLGAGAEKIEQELKELYPETSVLRLDSDISKMSNKQNILKKFQDLKGAAILIGTETALNLWEEKVANVAVLGLDAWFCVPDFRISEKIFNVLLSLRQLATKRFLIQTRNAEEKVFRYATEGNLIDFYRDEIAERLRFGYPPFRVLIKISRTGIKEEVTSAVTEVAEQLKDYQPLLLPLELPNKKGLFQTNLILKLLPTAWVDQKLLNHLKSLAPTWLIEVEPTGLF